MNLPIIIYDSPILRKKTTRISDIDNVELIAKNLLSTLNKERGLGLAGPQVGIQKQIFVIDTTQMAKENPLIPKVEIIVLNPEIIWFSKVNDYYNEGCLSIPGIYEDVLRPETIYVRYNDTDFNIIEERLNGMKARIFQHEYDHLKGVLFIDRLSPLKRKLISGELKKIARRE